MMKFIADVFSMDDDKFKRTEFVVKYSVLAVVGLWTLMIATGWVSNKSEEIELAQKEYELETSRLGSEGLYPKALTDLTVKTDNALWGENKDLCTISGQYTIENIGGFPIYVSDVEFTVYELEPLTENDLKGKEVASFSLSSRLEHAKPLFEEEMEVKENITTSNRLERSFGYVIKVKEGALYTIKASANGGIPSGKKEMSPLSVFSKNDLTHISGSHRICTGS